MEKRKVKHMTIDFTGLNTWRSCPQKFNYGYVVGRKPAAPSDPLAFGSCIHEGLAVWHSGSDDKNDEICKHNFDEFISGPTKTYRVPHDCVRCRMLAKFVEVAHETHLPQIPDDKPRSVVHGLNILWAYANAYGWPKKTFVPLMDDDMNPRVEVAMSLDLKPWLTYRGRMDMVANEVTTGAIVGVEHKTTYYLNEAFLNKARLSDQVTGYIYLMKETIAPDAIGIYWNALQTAPRKILTDPGSCFSRNLTRRTDEQLWEWEKRTIRTAERIREDIESGVFSPNFPDACCAWNSLCAFADVCQAPRDDRDAILSASYAINEWEGVKVEYED